MNERSVAKAARYLLAAFLSISRHFSGFLPFWGLLSIYVSFSSWLRVCLLITDNLSIYVAGCRFAVSNPCTWEDDALWEESDRCEKDEVLRSRALKAGFIAFLLFFSSSFLYRSLFFFSPSVVLIRPI